MVCGRSTSLAACEKGLIGFCLSVNPEQPGGAYGYPSMGGYEDGQAEYLRVPFGDFNCLRLPEEDAREQEADCLDDHAGTPRQARS